MLPATSCNGLQTLVSWVEWRAMTWRAIFVSRYEGLTLVHLSTKPEPFLTLGTVATQRILRKVCDVEPESGRV